MFPTWARWPLVGLFLVVGGFAHGGFHCDKTDPGVATDPGVTTETATDEPVLAPADSGPSVPVAALGALPLVGGLVAVLARRRP